MKGTHPIISLSQVFILALLLFHFTPVLPVLCWELPKEEPILRLETGMHAGIINTIGVDAKNRYLVSGSDDKTVRVWELPQGRLVTTLRPRIRRGGGGNISSVDISPDGSTIVAAGLTGFIWEEQAGIYIFDRPSGGMKTRITGFPQAVNRVKFSPDGGYLVAGLVGVYGIRVYRTSDWSLLKNDPDYGDAVMGLDFDGKGRLVTVALDGCIRMYDADFQLPPRIKKAEGGNGLASVAFSPDGSKIAICYAHSVRVDVHSSSPDLRYLFSADTTGIPMGSSYSLFSVCWASDGSLFAGGNYRDNRSNIYFIRKWADAVKDRPYVNLQASRGTVFSLRPLKDGAIAFACSDGIGVFDRHGRKTFYRGWDIPDELDRLLVSDDAKTVQFCFDYALESAARFSLAERHIELEPERLPTLKAAITEAEAIKVEDWDWISVGQRAGSPKLNGKPLGLFAYEKSHSFAICPGGQSFLLGTDQNIRLFGKNGTVIWRIPAASTVRSINVAHDGVFVASFANGTIRWYRVKDGKELLAFFPHRDNKRWVLWTPKGYYDASIGGEDLIGWHVNKWADKEADFFPVSRFRSDYYRPDVIEEVLKTLDVDEAVKRANIKARTKERAKAVQELLPPVVEIISPADNSEVETKTLTIRYRVRSPAGAPVIGIRVFVDGGLSKEERGLNLVGADIERKIQVDLPERDCEIGIVTENRHGWGVTAKRRLMWTGTKDEKKGVLYVLTIGVTNYKDDALKKGVKRAADDARDFGELLKKQKRGRLYRDVQVTTLQDDQATRDSVITALKEIGRQATVNDLIMLFVSGHGEKDDFGKYRYLLPDVDKNRLPSRCLSHSDIKDPLVGFPGRRVIFIDTCRSGYIIDVNGFANELASSENGRIIVFTSATGNQNSEEPPGASNGAFTKALLEGLGGKAAGEQRKVTVSRLRVYIEEEVPRLTNNRQKPDFVDLGGGALELAEVID